MSNEPSGHIYFLPDPFGDGQAVTIEATDRADADKQLKTLQDQRDKAPTSAPATQETPPAEQPVAEAVEPDQEGKTR